MIFFFSLISHGGVPASPLILYNIKFVQRGFTERIRRDGQGFTVSSSCSRIPLLQLMQCLKTVRPKFQLFVA
jgi:hypothetical protein